MEIKIKNFLGRERFQWLGGDANQLFISIWPYRYLSLVHMLFSEAASFAANRTGRTTHIYTLSFLLELAFVE